jgi:PKD repeat protein
VEFSAAWIFDIFVTPAPVYYCNAGTARQSIIDDFGWNLKDDGQECTGAEFETTWETTTANESVTIPTNSAFDYDYTIDWGDGTIENNQMGDGTHAYSSAGTYTVKITGDFPAIYFNNGGDKTKIKTIERWGGHFLEKHAKCFQRLFSNDL